MKKRIIASAVSLLMTLTLSFSFVSAALPQNQNEIKAEQGEQQSKSSRLLLDHKDNG